MRTRSADKLDRIVEAAGMIFVRNGYRGTQVGDVAREAGVSAGTIYLYVKGKASLFDLTIRRAFHDPAVERVPFPYVAPNPGRLVDDVWLLVSGSAQDLLGHPSLEREHPDDARDEFEALVRRYYRWVSDNWLGLEIVERCAKEWPELATLFYKQLRRTGLGLLASYLERRAEQGHLRRMPDYPTAARVIIENVAYFAMHRRIRPDSEFEDQVAEDTVIHVLVHAFVPDR